MRACITSPSASGSGPEGRNFGLCWCPAAHSGAFLHTLHPIRIARREVVLPGMLGKIMHLQTTGAVAQPKPFWKLLIKIAYLIVAVPAILLFFGLVVGIPD